MSSPSEKVCVVTGAAHGIGAATARLMSLKGNMNLVLSDQDKAGVETLRKQLDTIRPKSSISLATDVSDPKQMAQLMKAAYDRFGRLDVLINNAGVSPKVIKKTADSSLDDWNKVIGVNQSGVYYGMKFAIPYMLEAGGGIIVNVASLAGLQATPHQIAYSASKYAVIGMTKTAAMEYGKKNIRINAICPGYMDSQQPEHLHLNRPELKERIKKATPLGRYAKVDEISDMIFWLCSEQTSFMTGQAVTLDGGLSL